MPRSIEYEREKVFKMHASDRSRFFSQEKYSGLLSNTNILCSTEHERKYSKSILVIILPFPHSMNNSIISSFILQLFSDTCIASTISGFCLVKQKDRRGMYQWQCCDSINLTALLVDKFDRYIFHYIDFFSQLSIALFI